MTTRRPTLAALMAGILVLAAGFAALRSGTETSFRATFSLTALGLATATVAARGRGPFWYGFAVFGWSYLILALGPWLHDLHRIVAANPLLPTTGLLERLCLLAIPPPEVGSDLKTQGEWSDRYSNTFGVAQCLTVLVMAVLGGLLAGLLAPRRRRSAEPE